MPFKKAFDDTGGTPVSSSIIDNSLLRVIRFLIKIGAWPHAFRWRNIQDVESILIQSGYGDAEQITISSIRKQREKSGIWNPQFWIARTCRQLCENHRLARKRKIQRSPIRRRTDFWITRSNHCQLLAEWNLWWGKSEMPISPGDMRDGMIWACWRVIAPAGSEAADSGKYQAVSEKKIASKPAKSSCDTLQ